MADSGGKKGSVTKKEIKEKTRLILQSATNANCLVDLVELSDTEKEDVLLCFIKSVHKIFSKFIKEGKLISSKNSKQQSETEDGENPSAEVDPENVFQSWLFEKYVVVIKKLLQCMQNKSRNVQELSLCTLMKLLVAESKAKLSDNKKSPFLNNFFGKIIDEMVHPSVDMREMINRFSEYLEYDDIRFYVLKNLSRAIESQSDFDHQKSVKMLSINAYAMLSKVKMPTTDEEISNFLISPFDKMHTTTDSKDAQSSKQGVKSLKAQKKAFSAAWLSFLSQSLTPEIHKKVLLNLHNDVIPHLKDPKMLMDFLSDSYDIGGAMSLLALNSLFILIHKHNLDYPDFYKKLYALLQPGIFHAKYQARFFRLLDLFLSSTHLPSYLVAAFAKRLSGLALSAPPSGAVLVIKFVSNLLRRHPSCQILVHRKDDTKLLLSNESANIPTGSEEDDPFLPEEADPAKCNALQSSLWELKSLQHHYFPGMSPLIEGLEKPFGKAEVDIEGHFDIGYDDLFKKHCTSVTQRNAVLEYQPPKGILGKQILDLWCIE